MNNCSYCQKSFSTIYALKNHQKTAKYCLKLRGDIVINKKFKCEYCTKIFTSKQRIRAHHNICINYIIYQETKNLKQIIEEQKEQISKLQDKLENIALKGVTKPSLVTNNNTQIINMSPLKYDEMLEYSSELKLEHIQEGGEGLARFLLPKVKEVVMVCDVNRRNIKYKNEYGAIVNDKGGRAFQQMVGLTFKTNFSIICGKFVQMKEEKLLRIINLNDKLKALEEIQEAKSILLHIERMARGELTKAGDEMMKYLCESLGSQGAHEFLLQLREKDNAQIEVECSDDYNTRVVLEESETE